MDKEQCEALLEEMKTYPSRFLIQIINYASVILASRSEEAMTEMPDKKLYDIAGIGVKKK